MKTIAPLTLAMGSVLMALSAHAQDYYATFTASAGTVDVGSPIVFTTTVTDAGQAVNGGDVSFLNQLTGATLFGGATSVVTNGVATLDTSFSTAGDYTVLASYSGAGGLGVNSANVVTIDVVNPTPPASAPEIDPASAASALTLLLGGFTTLRGRKRE